MLARSSALPLERGGKGERQHSLCVPLPKSRAALQALRSEAEVVSSLLAAEVQENLVTTLLGDSETVDPLWRERETKELRVAIPNGRGTGCDAKSGRPANSHAAAEQTMADLIGILEVELRGSEDGLVSFPSSLPEL